MNWRQKPDSAAAAVQRFHSDSSCIRTAVAQTVAAWARRRPHRHRQSIRPTVLPGTLTRRTAAAASADPDPSWLTTATTTTAAASAADCRRHRLRPAPCLKKKHSLINSNDNNTEHRSPRGSKRTLPSEHESNINHAAND